MPPSAPARSQSTVPASAAQETLDSLQFIHGLCPSIANPQTRPVLFDMSQLLNTQLDKETLANCVAMIESGVNPEALAVCESIHTLL